MILALGSACVALTASLTFAGPPAEAETNTNVSTGDGAPFTGIYAFGDSLTDTGGFFELTGLPPAPYVNGRFSDGPVWIEYLADLMGVEPGALVNYSIGGATTGRDNENDNPGGIEFPGVLDEIDSFEADLDGKKADKRALYVIWAGANDFFVSTSSPQQTIATAIENTISAVQRLQDLGAQRIMVVNLPDLGLTPLGLLAEDGGTQLSQLSAGYNYNLASALDFYDLYSGFRTVRLDSAGIIQSMVGNPELFGLSNVNDPFIYSSGDPSEFLFWDFVHPTTKAHSVVAQTAMQVLNEEFKHAWATPRKGAAKQNEAAQQQQP